MSTRPSAVPRPFADTNVLLYLVSGNARKSGRAEALLASGLTVSVQVLNELVNVLRRKFGFDWDEVDRVLADSRDFLDVVSLTESTHAMGVRLARRHQFPVHDAMIVSSALLAGCTLLYSEDMHDGMRIEGRLRIKNPFAE